MSQTYTTHQATTYTRELQRCKQEHLYLLEDYTEAIQKLVHKLGLCLGLRTIESRASRLDEYFLAGLAPETLIEMARQNKRSCADITEAIQVMEHTLLQL